MRLKIILGQFWASHKNCPFVKAVKPMLKGTKQLDNNIHGIKDPKQYAEKYMSVHVLMKRRLIVPVFLLLDRFLDHIKIKEIPDTKHDYILKLWERCIDRVISDCNNLMDKKFLTMVKHWLQTFLCMDQAYKELFFMTTLNLAKILDSDIYSIIPLKLRHNPHYFLNKWNHALNIGLYDWHRYYRHSGELKITGDEILKQMKECKCIQRIKSYNDWFVTGLLINPEFLKLFNQVLLSVGVELEREFKDKRVVNHLIYKSRVIDDVAYFAAWEEVQKPRLIIGQFEDLQKKKEEVKSG